MFTQKNNVHVQTRPGNGVSNRNNRKQKQRNKFNYKQKSQSIPERRNRDVANRNKTSIKAQFDNNGSSLTSNGVALHIENAIKRKRTFVVRKNQLTTINGVRLEEDTFCTKNYHTNKQSNSMPRCNAHVTHTTTKTINKPNISTKTARNRFNLRNTGNNNDNNNRNNNNNNNSNVNSNNNNGNNNSNNVINNNRNNGNNGFRSNGNWNDSNKDHNNKRNKINHNRSYNNDNSNNNNRNRSNNFDNNNRREDIDLASVPSIKIHAKFHDSQERNLNNLKDENGFSQNQLNQLTNHLLTHMRPNLINGFANAQGSLMPPIQVNFGQSGMPYQMHQAGATTAASHRNNNSHDNSMDELFAQTQAQVQSQAQLQAQLQGKAQMPRLEQSQSVDLQDNEALNMRIRITNNGTGVQEEEKDKDNNNMNVNGMNNLNNGNNVNNGNNSNNNRSRNNNDESRARASNNSNARKSLSSRFEDF